MRIAGIIPARYGSTRFPGKPLADICGKPMIWWVYRNCSKFKGFSELILAIDDERVKAACDELSLPYVMTSPNHDTPTARIAEVVEKVDADLYIGIMGDEPLVEPDSFQGLIPIKETLDLYVAMLIKPLTEATDVVDTTNQKVVVNALGNIMLTSRSPIPFPKGSSNFAYYATGSTFAYTREALRYFNNSERSQLELAEENDLIRWLYQGVPVKAVYSSYKTVSVDSQKDLDRVRRIIAEKIEKEAEAKNEHSLA
ncbi:MAG: 3-deoxy-manno-octulosonate cytidylyltransferase [Clostridiales bacterium]|jgi:3-deoxy-manno-octulosonate cytidylyltransferase (CMP-KDO synthetase)|nr:3-deoxy-manno-octulosonate cytidylyltransferase [Clostridiales bacterium]